MPEPYKRRKARHADLQRNIIDFCRVLREREMLVTPSEVIDAIRTANAVDISDRQEFKTALRSVLTGKPEDIPIHDATFDEFWRTRLPERMEERGEEGVASQDPDAQGEELPQPQIAEGDESDADEDEEGLDMPLYSPVEVLAARDFSTFTPDEMQDIARAILVVARRLATRESRRYRSTQRGHAIDLRRTMRRNIKFGGTVVELARKKRKIRKPRIVLICDVSRSMDTYSKFLLQFIYALQNTLGKVESFVFSTRLTRVTDYFKTSDIFTALDRIAREVPDWSGGTRIGESLHTFNQEWALRTLNKHTIVLIMSDGLDTGDASVLEHEMEQIERRAARVIWLNPLLGNEDYRPLARGMSAALPHVALFASAHNLASLQALGRALAL
ncbi:MAG: VWA domain-containing protein [Chloroflexi bacterium]|nr:VWA domain-containing protein [Chloroflexota bacterium]